jgi:predicted outer membrane protein
VKRIPWPALLLVLLAGCATAPDPIAQDPAFDAAHPALSSEVVFEAAARACSV